MPIKQDLEKLLKDAMRSNDDLKKRTIRMALSTIKFVEVEKGNALDDAAVIGILQKEIKIRRESIVDAEKAGRTEIIEANQDEIRFLEGLIPNQMPENELREIIRLSILEINANSPGDMGKVMKIVLPKIQGRAPADLVSKLVKELLTAQ